MPLSRAFDDREPRPQAASQRDGSWMRAHRILSRPQAPVFLAVILAALVVMAISTSRSAGLITALWGAGGVAVTAWLRGGRGLGYDLAYAGLIATGLGVGNLLAGNSFSLAVMFTVANMIEIGLAVWLTRRFVPDLNLGSVTGAGRFLLFAAVLPPLPAALFAAGMLNVMVGQNFSTTFETWWFGHALGIAVLAPLGLALTRHRSAWKVRPWRAVEGLLLLVGLAAAVLAIFSQNTAPISFLIVPLMLTLAVRLRILGVTVGTLIVALIGIMATLQGYGPMQLFSEADMAQQVMLAQLFMVTSCLPMLLVAALLEERDRLAERAAAGRQRAESASAGKSRLLANVAHEIKSPIGGVIGIGELWSSGQLGPVTPTQAEMAEMLVKTARQIETLTHDLLDVARAESGAVQIDLRPVDVAGVVEDVRRSLELHGNHSNLDLIAQTEGQGLIALADSVRLAQVVNNLATNAVKYGASGGVVTLRTCRAGPNIRVEVVDKGPGLSPEKQAQLFEPFNRLGLERSSIEGHGIGLALAKRLTEIQNGRIGVISAPGEGALFWLELPAA